MLKKELYGLAAVLFSLLSFFISIAVIYNYSIYLENKDFYTKYTTINYENLVKDIKDRKFKSYSKNLVYSNSLKYSNMWYDTRRILQTDAYIFSYKDGKKVLYTEDGLNKGALNFSKEDKDLLNATYELQTDSSTMFVFFPFSFKGVFDILLIMFGLIFIIFAAQFLISEMISGKNFTKKQIDTNIDFEDIVGYEDVKKQFLEISEFIKNKKHFEKNSLSVPKGILLTGEPGVGKTLFAKAFANEVNATLFFASGSDFAEVYVGVGAKRVRSLFRSAQMATPAVIFIDEFDAIGSRSNIHNDSERTSIINQLLTEMDGLGKKQDIFVIATTNYESQIDKALLRPGRIDKIINVPLPDKKTKIEIMKKYLSDFFIEQEDLESLAIKSQNMSAASLKNLIEQIKSYHIKENGLNNKKIQKEIINLVFDEIQYGGKRNIDYEKQMEKRIALHELGHAFVSAVLSKDYTVEKVSIEARSKSLGATFMLPKYETHLYTYEQLITMICVLVAGRAAEEIFLSQASSGASDDLMKANTIANDIINTYGLGKDTPLLVDITPKNIIKNNNLEDLQQRQKLLIECFDKSKKVINFYKEDILQLSINLIEQKEITGKLIFDIIENKKYVDIN